MTTNTFWQPLASNPPSHASDSDALSSDTLSSDTLWYWLPGWSFTANIFESLYRQIPGRHMGLDYQALYHALNQQGFESAVTALRHQSSRHAHWVGWSLGGAIATATSSTLNARSTTVFGTGSQFCQTSDHNDNDNDNDNHYNHGMPISTLETFIQHYQQNAAKTLKRFTALCSQGSSQPRALSRTLAAHQSTPDAELITGLHWLKTACTAPEPSQFLALYGEQDALNPGGLQPSDTLPGSHAFWLEPDNQQRILTRLQRSTRP